MYRMETKLATNVEYCATSAQYRKVLYPAFLRCSITMILTLNHHPLLQQRYCCKKMGAIVGKIFAVVNPLSTS